MGANERSRYDGVAMIIHWVTAALMIFMVLFGEELMEAGEEAEEAGEALAGAFGPSLHVSLGAAVLALTLLRILWRLGHRAPPHPAGMKRWEVGLSHAVHGLFYLLLIGVPLAGWLAFGEFAREEPAMAAIRVFGAVPLPASPATGEWAKEVHEIGSNLAMLLIGLHVLAALKHQFIDRDGIMGRMLPG
ncbi:cytochrome b [Aestuariivirga sp.]|uniref:cytochrome b n=1 Tax=Aestuariivirga sp. TaxID=2650926 RepID=UPI00391A57C3